jgi:ArsR family transcriptional regulator
MDIEFSQFFRLLADETRLRALLLMQQEGELCVCELVHALGVIQPKVSRHLAALRDCGVVKDRRAGQWIYYQLHPDLPAWARQVLEATAGEATPRALFATDAKLLAKMPNRPDNAQCG